MKTVKTVAILFLVTLLIVPIGLGHILGKMKTGKKLQVCYEQYQQTRSCKKLVTCFETMEIRK